MNYKINIYFVRHGQAYHNISDDFYSKDNIDALLTPTGLIQSEEVGLKLQNIKFTKIYCSPLSRCIQTCNNILKYNNFDSEYIIDFHDYIQEYPYNVYSNLRKSKKKLQDYYIKSLTKYKYNDSHIYEKNDKNLSVEVRIINFFKDLRKNVNSNSNILIVSHNNLLTKMINLIFKIKINFIENCDIITLNNDLRLYITNIKIKNVALCLLTNDNKILFVRDKHTKKLMIPGGKIDKSDKSLLNAAYREFVEESEIKLNKDKILSIKYFIFRNHTVIIIIKYNITPTKTFYNIKTNETDAVYYLTLSEIKQNNLKLRYSNLKSFNELVIEQIIME